MTYSFFLSSQRLKRFETDGIEACKSLINLLPNWDILKLMDWPEKPDLLFFLSPAKTETFWNWWSRDL